MQDTTAFSSITPIFDFEFEHEGSAFSHYGRLEDSSYSIKLGKYQRGKPGFDELMAYADDNFRRFFDHMRSSYVYRSAADHFLIVQAVEPYKGQHRVSGYSSIGRRVLINIFRSLRLHCSKGISRDKTHHFRSPPLPDIDGLMSIVEEHRRRAFSHLGPGPSILPDSQFESCRSTFDALIKKNWDYSRIYDQVLRLALAYHETAFDLRRVEHSFLILMIVFEALFKREKETSAKKASTRISQLISTTQAEQKRIEKEFYGENDHSTLCRIRNKIAHGNPSVDEETIAYRYPDLYRYITNAMIRLLSIQDGTLDQTKDYYAEISRYCKDYFRTLPPV